MDSWTLCGLGEGKGQSWFLVSSPENIPTQLPHGHTVITWSGSRTPCLCSTAHMQCDCVRMSAATGPRGAGHTKTEALQHPAGQGRAGQGRAGQHLPCPGGGCSGLIVLLRTAALGKGVRCLLLLILGFPQQLPRGCHGCGWGCLQSSSATATLKSPRTTKRSADVRCTRRRAAQSEKVVPFSCPYQLRVLSSAMLPI